MAEAAPTPGVLAYGAYIPTARLQRSARGAVLGTSGGKGTRAVASYDEDTTSIGVEAARLALRGRGVVPDQLIFATASPAYLDKTNATAIHAALSLPRSALAFDAGGAVRSGVGAVFSALRSNGPTLVVLSDLRGGVPGSADEVAAGDAAAALVVGTGGPEAPVLAEVLGQASATAEFLDRWRLPGQAHPGTWEERFGEHAYLPLADEAFAAALKDAELTPDQVDHLIVAGTHGRACRAWATRSGAAAEAVVNDRTAAIGNPGTAQPWVLLADVLDRAGGGEVIVVMVLADGASALVLRTTDALAAGRSAVSVAAQIAGGDDTLAYGAFLTWKGSLDRESPRRPDPTPPAAPPSLRTSAWKYAFEGSRCTACATRHMPPARVCRRCHEVDQMVPEPMADVPAAVSTFTIDRLAFTPSPPLIGAVVDFDGGGRTNIELTDCDPAWVAIGRRVELTFRRTLTAGGIHNYSWKARPLRSSTDPGQAS
ncbi:OB-fold domain-containing protein [Sporichthya sp.]|uniref:OB-fold domain-containing protein n=1 Tax=Sporichthya sp. TaxID=65475 RepID=UPI001806EFF1|nr:OB-fold domain-containing protein [Sporichthya sp.]MBA3741470.1 OB-fold domain-containing protein [Sporichthya sp.]